MISFPKVLAVFVEEMADEQRNIIRPGPQGRQRDHHDIEPVVKILPEGTGLDHLFEVPVAGRDQAHIHRNRFDAAHPQKRALFDETQQLDLHAERHFADFIEKDRPLVGGFQQTDLGFRGPGEGPFFVAEEFVGDQLLGESAAVEGDKRLVRSRLR